MRSRYSLKPRRTADEVLDELARLGCDRHYVESVTHTLADWNWGKTKWLPPQDIKRLTLAGQVLQRFRKDFFLGAILRKLPVTDRADGISLAELAGRDDEYWIKRLDDTIRGLQACAEAVSRVSDVLKGSLKPSARRYILVRALINHVKQKTGSPMFTEIAGLIMAFGRTEYSVGKLQTQYERACRFYARYEEVRGSFRRQKMISAMAKMRKEFEAANVQRAMTLSSLTLSSLMGKPLNRSKQKP